MPNPASHPTYIIHRHAIPQHLADDARTEILDSLVPLLAPELLSKPCDFPYAKLLPPGEKTVAAMSEFVQNSDKSSLAQLMHPTSNAEVIKSRLIYYNPVYFTQTIQQPYSCPSREVDMIYTFLAYGPLSYENGLPALGEDGVKLELESGDAVHVLGTVRHDFKGLGGGTGQVIWWSTWWGGGLQ